MRKIALALAILGTTLVSALYTAPAHAQATRTWVSGVGDDANPCSRTAPCKTWAGAIAKTSAGGEIDNLDAGGFGALTITKSITLDGGGGAVASTLVSGTNGITVAAGSTDVVIIKNIRFQGLLGNGSSSGTAGLTGINVVSAAQVVIENCEIYGFNTAGIGVSLSATGIVQVLRTQMINNAVALSATASSGLALVEVYGSTFVGTNTGGSATQGGALAGSNSNVTIGYSNFQDLTYGAQIQSGAQLEVDNSLLFTSVGVQTNSGTTAFANNNSYYGNGPLCNGAGTLKTAGNNKLGGNASAGTCSVSATMTQQ
jgi:hypothetical protein